MSLLSAWLYGKAAIRKPNGLYLPWQKAYHAQLISRTFRGIMLSVWNCPLMMHSVRSAPQNCPSITAICRQSLAEREGWFAYIPFFLTRISSFEDLNNKYLLKSELLLVIVKNRFCVFFINLKNTQKTAWLNRFLQRCKFCIFIILLYFEAFLRYFQLLKL